MSPRGGQRPVAAQKRTQTITSGTRRPTATPWWRPERTRRPSSVHARKSTVSTWQTYELRRMNTPLQTSTQTYLRTRRLDHDLCTSHEPLQASITKRRPNRGRTKSSTSAGAGSRRLPSRTSRLAKAPSRSCRARSARSSGSGSNYRRTLMMRTVSKYLLVFFSYVVLICLNLSFY